MFRKLKDVVTEKCLSMTSKNDLVMGKCDKDNDAFYWKIDPKNVQGNVIENKKYKKCLYRTGDKKLSLNNCQNGTKYVFPQNQIRDASTHSLVKRPKNTTWDGCLGVSEGRYNNFPIYDNSSTNMGDYTQRHCDHTWKLLENFESRNYGPCQGKIPNKNQYWTCDPETRDFKCLPNFGGHNCMTPICDEKKKPARNENAVCDPHYGEWKCKDNWYGKNCDIFVPNDLGIRNYSGKTPIDVMFDKCINGIDTGGLNDWEDTFKLECEKKFGKGIYNVGFRDTLKEIGLSEAEQEEARKLDLKYTQKIKEESKNRVRKNNYDLKQKLLKQRKQTEKEITYLRRKYRQEMDEINKKYDYKKKDPENYEKMVQAEKRIAKLIPVIKSKMKQLQYLETELTRTKMKFEETFYQAP